MGLASPKDWRAGRDVGIETGPIKSGFDRGQGAEIAACVGVRVVADGDRDRLAPRPVVAIT